MNALLGVLSKLVDSNKLGGWIRAGVASGLAVAIAKWPLLGQIVGPDVQAEIGAALAGIAVGYWSHVAKNAGGGNA